MKRVILTFVSVLLISMASFGQKVLAEGKTFSALGDYKLVSVENPVPLKGDDCKAYRISYANTPMDVTVIVCKERGCKKYVVLSDKLSVQYVCNSSYFGVERLDKAFEAEGYTTDINSLNRVEYFRQKVLGPGSKPELEATSLIAAYFPFLLNTNELTIASR